LADDAPTGSRWKRRAGGLDQAAAYRAVQGLARHSFVLLGAVRAGKNRHGGADGWPRFCSSGPSCRVHLLPPTGKSGGTAQTWRSTAAPPLCQRRLAGQLAGLPAPPCIACWRARGVGPPSPATLWPCILVVVDEVSMLGSDPGQRPARSPCRSKPAALVGDPRPSSGQVDQGPSSSHCHRSKPGLGEAANHTHHHYRNQVDRPPLPIGCAKGSPGRAPITRRGANDNILWLRCAAPRLPAETSRCACERSGRLGNAPGFQPSNKKKTKKKTNKKKNKKKQKKKK